MKKITTIKFTIIALLIGGSLCSLNAQIRVFANSNVRIGSETNGLNIFNNGSVFTGNQTNMLIYSGYNGRIEIGNTVSSRLHFDQADGMVRLISKTSPQNQFVFEPNGTIKMGNTTNPAMQVNPNGNVNINGNVGINGTVNFAGSNSQIGVNFDYGTLYLGSLTTSSIQINDDGIIIKKSSQNQTNGFQFIRSEDIIAQWGLSGDRLLGDLSGPGLHYIMPVMALTGFYNRGASIGTFQNAMNVVHSHYYFSSGDYIGVLVSSDSNLKNNIRDLMPVSERIAKLRPVMYDFIVDDNTDGEISPDNTPAKIKSKGNGNNGNGNNGNNGNGNGNNGNNGNGNGNNNNDENRKDRVGFLAQEVLPLFPDLVVMGGDSSLRLDYAGLIPYLTKAIQEQTEIMQTQNNTIQQQNQEISELRNQMHDIQKGIYTADFIITEETKQPAKASKQNETGNVLFQNAPNPFNISTTIKHQLSDNAANAKICIYNLTGKQLQCYNLQATKGENSIEVRASSLQSGMYLYSLIVGDKLIATKRMVLTE
jgi:hypothetical protein